MAAATACSRMRPTRTLTRAYSHKSASTERTSCVLPTLLICCPRAALQPNGTVQLRRRLCAQCYDCTGCALWRAAHFAAALVGHRHRRGWHPLDHRYQSTPNPDHASNGSARRLARSMPISFADRASCATSELGTPAHYSTTAGGCPQGRSAGRVRCSGSESRASFCASVRPPAPLKHSG